MKLLKRIRYYTMNSWNLSTAPAYNLKVPRVVRRELQDAVFALMEGENFYVGINSLVSAFNADHDYAWQAGWNGRSGGYLVLYRGGRSADGQPYCMPGRQITDADVPGSVLRDFRRLALDIIRVTEDMARTCVLADEPRMHVHKVVAVREQGVRV
jgi:hypothetical protein